MSTVPKTLIKMLTLQCNNWSQSFLKLSRLPTQSNLSVNVSICDIMNDVTKNI